MPAGARRLHCATAAACPRNAVQPLERIVDRLSRAWGTVSHLKAVKDTEELRKVRGRGRLPAPWRGVLAGVRDGGWLPVPVAAPHLCSNCNLAVTILFPPPPPHTTTTTTCRQAVEEVQPERVKLSLRLSQSKPL